MRLGGICGSYSVLYWVAGVRIVHDSSFESANEVVLSTGRSPDRVSVLFTNC
jgi:hypothetical protein